MRSLSVRRSAPAQDAGGRRRGLERTAAFRAFVAVVVIGVRRLTARTSSLLRTLSPLRCSLKSRRRFWPTSFWPAFWPSPRSSPRRRVTIALTLCAIIALCLYLGGVVTLYVTQRSMMYFPETVRTTPAQAGLPEAQEVDLTAADGGRSLIWHIAPRAGGPIIIYFHGNGGALRYSAKRFRTLAEDGVGVVALEYRGYGGQSGDPTEAGLIADAEAAYAFAAARYPVQRLVLWGDSLGSGIAVAVAAEKAVGAVILEAPFTSAADVGAARYWYMPVRLLMKDQYRSDERIAKITAPVLILHGLQDRVIPFAMGERLFDLTKAPRHIVRFLDGGHENLDANGALHAVRRFLRDYPEQRSAAKP